MVNSTQKKNIL